MNWQMSSILISCAAFPILAAIGSLIFTSAGHHRLNLIAITLGCIGGCVCSAILAMILANAGDPDSSIVQLRLLTWFSFSLPNSAAMNFGLEGTVLKTGLISIFGAMTFVSVWLFNSRRLRSPTDDALLTTSWLYAAGTIFILAPNTGQSFLGWGAVGFLTVILMRLLSRQSQHPSGRTQESAVPGTPPQINNGHSEPRMRPLETLGSLVAVLERACVACFWRCATVTFPNWLAEQAELPEIKDSSALCQLITALGASAILLTWLL